LRLFEIVTCRFECYQRACQIFGGAQLFARGRVGVFDYALCVADDAHCSRHVNLKALKAKAVTTLTPGDRLALARATAFSDYALFKGAIMLGICKRRRCANLMWAPDYLFLG
jgi:hypothetical protein